MAPPAENKTYNHVIPAPAKKIKYQEHGVHETDEAYFRSVSLGTAFVHAGCEPDETTGAVVPSISMSTTFKQFAPGVHNGYEYSRSGNPSRTKLELTLAAAEGATHAYCFSSGSAATATVVHATCKTGDHIITVSDVYGGTQRYLRQVAGPVYGITTSFVDFDDEAAIMGAVVEGKTKLFWLETPTNPTLKVTSIKRIAEIAHKVGAVLCVDNTFMSPWLQHPLAEGADIVAHSCTKSIGGHSDVVMGVVCTSNDDIGAKVQFHQNALGAVPSPFDSFLCQRGLKTLHIRMQRSCENAQAVAEFLENHAFVRKVNWPFLKSHPEYEIAKSQQDGGGMVVTFWIAGDTKEKMLAASKAFLKATRLFVCAESLGAVESLAEHPLLMTHASVPEADRIKLGIDEALIRLSVGIESSKDLLGDLAQALKAGEKAASEL